MAWQTTYYDYDGMGNVVALTDESGQPTGDQYVYSAFGELLAASVITDNSFLYNGRVGYYHDSWETGDYYVRARTHAPTLARWLSADPLAYAPDDFNQYRFLAGIPIALLDPTGELRALLFGGPISFNCYRYVDNDPLALVDPTGKLGTLLFGTAAPRWWDNLVAQVRSLIQRLKEWLDKIPCGCELAVGAIPWAVDELFLPNRPSGFGQWPWQHCMSGCMMVGLCGGDARAAQCAARIALASEIVQYIWCKLYEESNVENPEQRHSCNSAFQQSDFRDNAYGRNFGRCCAFLGLGPILATACCELACRNRFNLVEGDPTDPTNLPYGPFGKPPGPWPTWSELIDDLW